MGRLGSTLEQALLGGVHPDLESLVLGHCHGITMAVRTRSVNSSDQMTRNVTNLAGLRTPSWFSAFFAALEARLDPASGLFGEAKPPTGDTDQIGGTFHYAFLYEWAHRPLPFPEAHIDAVLGLQRADGLWDQDNPLWLTLDAVYLLSRAVRRCDHRRAEVHRACRDALVAVAELALTAAGRRAHFEEAELGAHALTAAVSLLAEGQSLLGADAVRTDHPLRLVLDRRPFV